MCSFIKVCIWFTPLQKKLLESCFSQVHLFRLCGFMWFFDQTCSFSQFFAYKLCFSYHFSSYLLKPAKLVSNIFLHPKIRFTCFHEFVTILIAWLYYIMYAYFPWYIHILLAPFVLFWDHHKSFFIHRSIIPFICAAFGILNVYWSHLSFFLHVNPFWSPNGFYPYASLSGPLRPALSIKSSPNS